VSSEKNDFFSACIEDSGEGKEGITNYIHMLGSGHITYYMKAQFKLAFFNHTQPGRNFGTNVVDREKSYFKSIFMFFQWEVLWVSGVAEEHFLTNLDE